MLTVKLDAAESAAHWFHQTAFKDAAQLIQTPQWNMNMPTQPNLCFFIIIIRTFLET